MADNPSQSYPENAAFKRTLVDKNGLSYTICPVEKNHFDDVVTMYELFEPKESAQGLPPKDPVRRKELIYKILNGAVNLIARNENGVIGHCALLDIKPGVSAELLIVIHQDWQGLGIAREMTSLLIDIARFKKYKKIWLTADASNTRVVYLYKKFGFTFIETLSSEREMELILEDNQYSSGSEEKRMRRTGIVRDTIFLQHKTGIHHPESPRRLETIYNMLDRNKLMEKLILVPSRLASLEEVEMVHAPEYIDKIMETAGEHLRYLDPDTVTSAHTYQAAFSAVGGSIDAVKKVLQSDIDNAFVPIRPPGHHAEKNRQMGFCIFNNAALAAEYARKQFDLKRILLIDWDVHHCNGTQHIFESTDEVLVFSTHRSPFFPGTGSLEEKGTGNGLGYSVNVPLSPGKKDIDFIEIYRKLLTPIALEYKPQLIIVSAGFDTHYDDPIGGMKVTEQGYAYMTRIIMEIADRVCEGRVVAILEGGYDLGALRKSVKAVIETLQGSIMEGIKNQIDGTTPDPSTTQVLQDVRANYKELWKSLNND